MSPKVRRRLLWIGGSAGAVLVALYLLRWPLAGGLVRERLERAAAGMGARVERAELSGSLVFGLRLRDVVLRPEPGAAFREAAALDVEVRYGLFGLGGLELRVRGARVALAPGEKEAPPLHEWAREAVAAAPQLRFPGRLAVEDSAVTLADGRTLSIDHAVAGGDLIEARLRTPDFGDVRASAAIGRRGTLDAEARAARGPVSALRLRVGPPEADRRRPVLVEVHAAGQSILWQGTAAFDLRGRPDRAEGELSAGPGRARTSVDFISGTFRADGETTVGLRGDLTADVSVAGRVEGTIAGPPSSWALSGVVARSRGASYRGLRIDEAEASAPDGTLADLPWRARVRREDDLAEAEGVLRWNRSVEVTSTVRLQAARAVPYLRLLAPELPVAAADLKLEAKVAYGAAGVSVEGELQTGPGEAPGFSWRSARIAARSGPEGIHVKEVVVRDTPAGPTVLGTASVGPATPEGRSLQARVKAGEDELAVNGRLTAAGGFEGDLSFSGPLASLGVRPPETMRPVRLGARISGVPEAAGARIELALGAAFRISPKVILRREGSAWRLDVSPGTVLAGGRPIDLDDFRIEITPGAAALSPLGFRCRKPELSGRLAAAVSWNGQEVRGSLELTGPAVGDLGLEGFEAHARVNRRTGEVAADLAWGSESADHLIASGRVGAVNDFRLRARLEDLGNPAIAELLPVVGLAGSAAIELRLTGSRERPQLAGTLTLGDVSVQGLPPFRLAVPIRTEQGAVRLSAREKTPFGHLALEGRLPLADLGPRTPLELTARLDPADLEPLFARLPERVRHHLPKGLATVVASVGGTLGAPAARLEGQLRVDVYTAPKPLGLITGVLLSASLENRTLRLDTLEGRVGKGHFRATGTWELGARGRPLTAQLSGTELLIVDEDLVRVRVSPELVLSRSEAGWRLEGSADVPLVLYFAEFAAGRLDAGEQKVRQVRAPGLSLPRAPEGGFLVLPGIPGLDAVKLDVRAKSTGECRIENSVVGALLTAEGKVIGTLAAPALSGVGRVKSGEVKLTTGVFVRIEEAEVALPPEPGRLARVRFEGRTGYGKGAITLIVDGPLANPELRLTSDPPRSQEELLAYLAFGQLPGDVSGTGALGVLALRLYKEQAAARPRAEPKESLFDRLNPEIITGGERPGERRAPGTLPAGGSTRGTVVRTEYFINRYFSVVAEADREANVGGDVKLRVRF